MKLRTAMKARGFRPANTLHTYRTFGYLIGMMLVRSMERSERILGAMKCRGFNGRIPLIHEFHFGRNDMAFVVLAAATIAMIGTLELLHVATY